MIFFRAYDDIITKNVYWEKVFWYNKAAIMAMASLDITT